MSIDFGSILDQFEKQSGFDKNKVLKQKGDTIIASANLSINQLRKLKPEDTLNLHGYTGQASYTSALSFIKNSYNRNLRKISIICGKGLHSPKGQAIIKNYVLDAIYNSHQFITEYSNPDEKDGGKGAFWIILKKH